MPKLFDVSIEGLSETWTLESRGYTEVVSRITNDPKGFDLASAKPLGQITIRLKATGVARYYRLNHQGEFYLSLLRT